MDDADTTQAASSSQETDNDRNKTDMDSQGSSSSSEDGSTSHVDSHNERRAGVERSVDRFRWYHTVNLMLGGIVMCLVGACYAHYLYTLHENRLWFSNILEVEREISFRTESGLYYSYYKQMVQARSFTEGLWDLTRDNITENWRTINILNRFNVYQEVFLAALYRSFPFISDHLSPIFFYIHSIFALHGGYVMVLYGLSWLLTDSWLAGLVTAAFYVCNRSHTTRVDFTVPLRESFALPLYSLQILMVTLYLRKSSNMKYEKLKLLAVYLTTCSFTITWQFAQFILLLQSGALYTAAILGLLSVKKVQQLLLCSMTSILSVAFLQFSNKMLLGSLALSFILAAYCLLAIMSDRSPTIGLFHNVWRVCVRTISVLGLTALINYSVKVLLEIDDDQHIYKFLQAKFGLTSDWDFDTHLYICHSAFEFMSWLVVKDLSNGLVLPIYLVTMAGLLGATLLTVCKRWTAIPSEEVPNFKHRRDPPAVDSSLLRTRPELAFHMLHSALTGFMAAMVLRMKYVWVPQACVLAAIGVGLPGLWKTLLATTSNTIVQVARNSALLITLILLLSRTVPDMQQELEVLQEFYDPDTVDLMEWINHHTPRDSAFSGSMQLMAGVKLCTGRRLTNHPHYEDKELRERTLQLLQVYGRHPIEEVYSIHVGLGSDYVILEDSICLARGPQGCRMVDAIDMANGHIPDYAYEGESDGEYSLRPTRFCQVIKEQTLQQMGYFMKVFQNRTFRIYQVMVNRTLY